MDGYISKPIRAQDFFEVVESDFTVRRDEPRSEPTPKKASHESVLDMDDALSRVAGDVHLLREVAAVFEQEYGNMLHELGSAIERRDHATVQRSAHTIKTSLGYFGARGAALLARNLEELGRNGKLSDAPAFFSELEETIRRMVPSLTEFVRTGKIPENK
jgi:HPt (histidine-containing phosphotransfer) domain-containing protein